jgi:hypothetical protein
LSSKLCNDCAKPLPQLSATRAPVDAADHSLARRTSLGHPSECASGRWQRRNSEARAAADVVRKGPGKLILDFGRQLPSLDRWGVWGSQGFGQTLILTTRLGRADTGGGEAKGIDGMLRSWVFIRGSRTNRPPAGL